MTEAQAEQADAIDVVNGDGTLPAPGRSIFDRLPDASAKPWEPPSDAEHAAMQTAIGDAYAAWSDRMSENPPPLVGLAEHGDEGEYPPFSYLFDASGEQRDGLRGEVMNVVRADAGGA